MFSQKIQSVGLHFRSLFRSIQRAFNDPSKDHWYYAPLFSLPVIVAALGYFVDIYDLLLFSIVRVPSLTQLGLNAEQISSVGTNILNWQMGGLLLGGILWGVLGDKRGRLSVLFGSIITYSLPTLRAALLLTSRSWIPPATTPL
jgi:MFS family permease